MATKAEMEEQMEFLARQNEQLAKELAMERAKRVPTRVNPFYWALVQEMKKGPKSILELGNFFERDSRTISQWLFQLKQQHGAVIITLNDGKKKLENDPFEGISEADVYKEAK